MKKRLISASTPTGNLTLGNYLGALKYWSDMQDVYECFFPVINIQAISPNQNPKELQERTLSFLALYIACGIDPEKSKLFIQSQIKEHTELFTILCALVSVNDLKLSNSRIGDINQELYSVGAQVFPISMAADILIYQADLVPVGLDSRKDVEFVRLIASNFNRIFGPTFKVPDWYVPDIGGEIYSLQESDRKMSKSDKNKMNAIYLLDSTEIIREKIAHSTIDSAMHIVFDPQKYPGISNLITIYSSLTGKNIHQVEKIFGDQPVQTFKTALSDTICEKLMEIQCRYAHVIENKDYLNNILEQGREKAVAEAQQIMIEIREKVGLL